MISALYIRKDSIYKKLDIDCWDEQRDARFWPGGNACIVHPPCAQWGRLSAFAAVDEEIKQLSRLAVDQVRKWGGILEHPLKSKLWKEMRLPNPGTKDEFGGFTLSIDQHWWGFPARKKTLLYIVGCNERDLPAMPLNFDAVTMVVAASTRSIRGEIKEMPKGMRDKTCPALAAWLVEGVTKIEYLRTAGNRSSSAGTHLVRDTAARRIKVDRSS